MDKNIKVGILSLFFLFLVVGSYADSALKIGNEPKLINEWVDSFKSLIKRNRLNTEDNKSSENEYILNVNPKTFSKPVVQYKANGGSDILNLNDENVSIANEKLKKFNAGGNVSFYVVTGSIYLDYNKREALGVESWAQIESTFFEIANSENKAGSSEQKQETDANALITKITNDAAEAASKEENKEVILLFAIEIFEYGNKKEPKEEGEKAGYVIFTGRKYGINTKYLSEETKKRLETAELRSGRFFNGLNNGAWLNKAIDEIIAAYQDPNFVDEKTLQNFIADTETIKNEQFKSDVSELSLSLNRLIDFNQTEIQSLRTQNIFNTDNLEYVINGGDYPQEVVQEVNKKLGWLNYRANKQVFVLIKKINYALSVEDTKKFADEIWNDVELDKDNTILLCVPFYQYTDQKGDKKTLPFQSLRKGENLRDINLNSRNPGAQSLVDYTNEIYKALPKPYREYIYNFSISGANNLANIHIVKRIERLEVGKEVTDKMTVNKPSVISNNPNNQTNAITTISPALTEDEIYLGSDKYFFHEILCVELAGTYHQNKSIFLKAIEEHELKFSEICGNNRETDEERLQFLVFMGDVIFTVGSGGYYAADKLIIKESTKIAGAAALDIGIQTVLNYYLNPEVGGSWDKALKGVDYTDAAYAGVSSLANDQFMNASVSCLRALSLEYLEKGEVNFAKWGASCGVGLLVPALGKFTTLAKDSRYAKIIATNIAKNIEGVAIGLHKLGVADEIIDGIIYRFGSSPDLSEYAQKAYARLQALEKNAASLSTDEQFLLRWLKNKFNRTEAEDDGLSRLFKKYGADGNQTNSVGKLAARLEEFPDLANQLKTLDDEGKEFLEDFANASDEVILKLGDNPQWVGNWKALSGYSTLRRNLANLEILESVKARFTHSGKTGQEALEEIFKGHKSVQKFIDNFKKFNDVIGNVDDITITGIKSSSEVRILNKGNQVGKIIDGKLNVSYSGFGGNIVCDPNKTTTLIGKWTGGTEDIWNTSLAKQVDNITGNPEGINILGVVDMSPSPSVVWHDQNKPWLDAAISRGDVIRVVSDPLDINHVFFNKNNIPTSVFSSPETLANYLKDLSESTPEVSQLGFYGREIRHLFQNGYTYNEELKIFSK